MITHPPDLDFANRAAVLIDGDCILCSRLGRFISRHDAARRFELIAINSESGQQLIARHAITDSNNSFILIDAGRVYTKSAAAFRVADQLGGPARCLGIFRFLPRAWADALYDVIARNRHRIFKGNPTCKLTAVETQHPKQK